MTDRFVTVPDSLELPTAVKVPAARISDSTESGRALLTGADAAAQRTSLGLGTAAVTDAGDFATAAQGAKADAVSELDILTSATLRRIIALGEYDELPTLLDRDLIIRYAQPGNTYYKDFSADTINNPPAGMTNIFGTGMAVKSVTGATGGKALQASDSTSGATAWAITESLTDPYLYTVEILSRWYRGTSHGISCFFNVNALTDTYYRASYNSVSGASRARITVRKDGANVAAPEFAITAIPTSTWAMTRARRQGGVTYVKHWAETEAEPSGWQFSYADNSIPAGPAAVGTGGGLFYNLDWFVVATGGKPAVKP